jgi:PAS domain S-box-containing protein
MIKHRARPDNKQRDEQGGAAAPPPGDAGDTGYVGAGDMPLLNFALNCVREAVYVVDAQARLLHVNDEASRTLGYTREEFLAFTVPDIDPGFQPERWTAHWRELQAAGALLLESEHRCKDGRLIPVEVNANYFEYGGAAYNLALVRDISARRTAEAEHRAHLRFFQSMDRINRVIQRTGDLTPMMQDMLDVVLSVFDCDRAWLAFPCDPDAPVWQVPMERTRPPCAGLKELGQPLQANAEYATNARKFLESSEPLQLQADSPTWPTASASELGFKSLMAIALRPKIGQAWLFGIHQCSHARRWTAEEEVLFREIARRVEDALTGMLAHRDLRESERQFRTLAEHTPDFIVRWDRDLRRLFVNPAFVRAMGAAHGELIHTTLGSIPPTATSRPLADAVSALRQRVTRVFALGQPDELEISWGTVTGERTFHTRLMPERDASGEVASVLGIGRDVTLLKEQEYRFRTLAENSPDLIARFDSAGRYLYVNPSYARLVGEPPEKFPGKHIGKVATATYNPPGIAVLRDAVLAVFASGTSVRREVRVPAADGDHYFDVVLVPERDHTGNIVSVLDMAHEITVHKRAEQAAQEANLELERRVAERTAELAAANKELETFAYSVSHDLKAPLRWIDGYSRLLKEKYGEQLSEDANGLLGSVLDATRQMHVLINDLLSYSRLERHRGDTEPVQLDVLVDTAVGNYGAELKSRHVDLRVTVPPMQAMVDRKGVAIVLRNLLANALKFTRDATPPVIEIGGRPEGDRVLLWVRDNGIGFDMQYHDRIFEVFQRLHRAEDYPGTGIGLAMVRKAVERMGGRIWAESTPGAGATFFVELPQ